MHLPFLLALFLPPQRSGWSGRCSEWCTSGTPGSASPEHSTQHTLAACTAHTAWRGAKAPMLQNAFFHRASVRVQPALPPSGSHLFFTLRLPRSFPPLRPPFCFGCPAARLPVCAARPCLSWWQTTGVVPHFIAFSVHQSIFQDLAASQHALRPRRRMASPQCDSLAIDVPPHPSQKPSHFLHRSIPFLSPTSVSLSLASTAPQPWPAPTYTSSACPALAQQLQVFDDPASTPHSLLHPTPLAQPLPLATLAATSPPDPSALLSLPHGRRNACTSPQPTGPCLTRGPTSTSPATQTDGSACNATLPLKHLLPLHRDHSHSKHPSIQTCCTARSKRPLRTAAVKSSVTTSRLPFVSRRVFVY